MRYTGRKGWKASYKDTWSLDCTLSPIIFAGLKKFRQVVEEKDYGVPNIVMCNIFPEQSKEGNYTEEQLNEGAKEWLRILDKMIYAFDEDSEPDITDYDFKFVSGPEDGKVVEGGCIRMDLVPNNEEEYQRYTRDGIEYHKLKQEGLNLFAEYYCNLWW